MARINQFDSFPLIHRAQTGGNNFGIGSLFLQYVYIPGSLSFNNVQMIISRGHTSASATYQLGLYSFNAGTLSLANSASAVPFAANGMSWQTMSTSAAQDITPGGWWLGYLVAQTSGNTSLSNIEAQNFNAGGGAGSSPIGGPFFRGLASFSTGALPNSIATSDCLNEGGTNNSMKYWYVLISA